MRSCRLTNFTKKGRATRMYKTDYRVGAFWTRLIFFSIYWKVYRKITLRSTGIKKIPQGGTSFSNAFGENVSKTFNPFFPLHQCNFSWLFLRAYSRMKKRLASVNIAHPCYFLWVHNKRFDGSPTFSCKKLHGFGIHLLGERIKTKIIYQRVFAR